VREPNDGRDGRNRAEGCALRVAAGVGFPSGAHDTRTKALEAETAVSDGADELDIVIDLGSALSGDWKRVEVDIATVRAAVPQATLKVIVEGGALNRAQLIRACNAAEAADAQFVKISTAFHRCGGAMVADIQTMADTVSPRLGVKASGGIRSAGAALELVCAGATRLGLSSTADVLSELTA
jgi:deoxyribose-phosphate aldolase